MGYWCDGVTQASRACIKMVAKWRKRETLEDAEQNCESSLALNYTSLVKGAGDAVTLRDELSGKEFSVTPSLVLNCGGAWADDINQRLSVSTNLIGGTLGSHLVMDRPDIAGQLGNLHALF